MTLLSWFNAFYLANASSHYVDWRIALSQALNPSIRDSFKSSGDRKLDKANTKKSGKKKKNITVT